MSVHISTGFFTESFTFRCSELAELGIHEFVDVC
uniref:Uncharacterized protein n=1 Tax=Myoviridae sp. ctVeR24 TaxID=2827689 RepID=A0A8S5SX54_9CAUD|nr:MAG TPA: hypothetical protein [Myoviridae sp. ctVeR24]